ncbi:hypothetical protein K8I61_19925 [bacterium]|nr:hypothetical protein [bacterium]
MKRLVVTTLAMVFLLAASGVGHAWMVGHEDFWVRLDNGEYWGHLNGVHLSKMKAKFDTQGLQTLTYRMTPLRGLVRFVDLEVVVGGEVKYRRSSERAMNMDFHFLETVDKHFDDHVVFEKPVEGFNYADGKVLWYFEGGGKKYVVTWVMADDTVTTHLVAE